MKALLGTTALVSTLMLSSMASASWSVTNGDFSDGLTGWTASVQGGVTTLSTNDLILRHAALFAGGNGDETINHAIDLAPMTPFYISWSLLPTDWQKVNPYSFTVTDSQTGANVADYSETYPETVGWKTYVAKIGSDDATSDYTLSFDYSSDIFPSQDMLLANVAVPEPTSIAILGVGMLGVAALTRRKTA